MKNFHEEEEPESSDDTSESFDDTSESSDDTTESSDDSSQSSETTKSEVNEGLKDSDDVRKWIPFSFNVNNSESDYEESKESDKSKESDSTKKSPLGSESTKSPEESDVFWDIAWKNFFISVVIED